MSKVFKIAVDAGHGGNNSTPGKRTPDNEYEWTFNDKVVRAFIEEMKNYENVEVRRYDDVSGRTDVPLATRTNSANSWGADIYISFHKNANTGRWSAAWGGTETYRGTSKETAEESIRLAQCVHPELVKAMGLTDRGIKTANFHITRETKMPSILLESGFMDSTIDIVKLRDDRVLKQAGINVANGVAKYGNLKRKQTEQPSTNGNYSIKSGDTFYGLSQRYNFTLDQLIKANPNVDVNNLQIGQKIVLPSQDKVVKTETQVKTEVVQAPKVLWTGYVKVDTLNVRSGAGVSNKQVGQLKKDEEVKVYEEKNGWLNIGNGRWISNVNNAYVTKEKPKKATSSKYVGKIRIVGVTNAAIVMDKPDRNNSKNIGTVRLNSTHNLYGSVRGKNNPNGYWEIDFNGRRAYVSGQFGRRV